MSVIIVTYNSRAFIDECLASVTHGQGDARVETIVVDNASLDGSAEHLETAWPEVVTVRAGWNSGFSRACNQGASYAQGTWLLFLNGDAVLAPHALDRLLAAAPLDASGVFAPRVLHPDGSDQQTARSFPTPSAFFFGRRSPLTRMFPDNRFSAKYLSGSNPTSRDPYEIDWVSGAALMIGRQRFDQLDGFDEGFFMYWEDADLCRRVKDTGGSVWCVPRSRAVHAEGSSASTTSPKQNKRFHRGAYRYASKHLLRGPAVVLRPFARGALSARQLAVAISRPTEQEPAPTAMAPVPIPARS